MVLFFCLTTLQNWQNCPAALTNHSGFLSIQLGFFRTSRGGANTSPTAVSDTITNRNVMTGIVSPTDLVVALKASYDALLASKAKLLAEKDKEIAHRDSQIC